MHGTARITDGGGPQLLQELAHVFLGPDVKFPAFDNPPPGRIMHIAVERIAGVGPWHAETETQPALGTEENKAVVRRWMHEVLAGADLGVADEVLAQDYVNVRDGGRQSSRA